MRNTEYKVQVIDRALAILEVLASGGPSLTLAELASRLKLPKTTVLRLLGVLQNHRFVERENDSGDYRLGLRLVELGASAAAQFNFGERARPHLERLMGETGESAFLSVLDGAESLALERVESSRTVRVPVDAARRTPVHCTASGKALIAYLPESELIARLGRRKLQAFTGNTLTTIAELRQELKLVREAGYAIDREEMEEGLKCIAAPVRNHGGAVVASVAILGPAFRLPDKNLRAMAASVVRTARGLSEGLGYRERPADQSRVANEIGEGL